MSGIAPKQNALKFKIAPHKQTFIVNKIPGRWAPWPMGPCAHLSTMINLALTPRHVELKMSRYLNRSFTKAHSIVK
jgi:hypothetical protein